MSITDTLYNSYNAALEQLRLTPGQQIVVALGGGADSQTVLDLTLRYRQEHPEYTYLAIHLDHYFHPDSPEWAAFLADYCRAQKIEAIVEPLTVELPGRRSKEAQGRDARYQRLAELTEPDAVILLGQHLSDQTETFMLQLKRGAGPKGLAAMAQVAFFKERRRVCRPLLGHSKDDILHYARSRAVLWIEDDTNRDTRIDRNFLRHDVIPLLRKRWPQFEKVVARSASLCAQQQQLLDELLTAEVEQRTTGETFTLSGWNHLSAVHQAALLRAWLTSQAVSMPSHAVMQNILQQVSAGPDAKLAIRWGNYQLRRFQHALYLLPAEHPVQSYNLEWNGTTAIEPGTNNGILLSDEKKGNAVKVARDQLLIVRNLRPGDKFRAVGRQQSRSLSRTLAKMNVAPWVRQVWPVVSNGEQIIWTPELGVNADYQPRGELTEIYPIWLKAMGSRASS